jgi:hypothetical protein
MCGLAFRSLLWPVCFALADAFDLWRVQGIDFAAALAAILFQHAPGQEQRPYEAESARPGSTGSADGCFPARCGRVLVIFACAEHAILARLENRRSAAVQAAIIASVQARIPMVTAEERCAHEVVLAERERAVWDGMRDLLEERAAGQAELASEASAASGAARASAADAAARSCAAGERIERLRRGEQVSRGEELDVERCPRDTRRGARYAGSYSLATRGYADANGINVRRSVRRGEGPE